MESGEVSLYREARLVGERCQSLIAPARPVLGTDSKVSLVLSKSSVTELHLQPSVDFFILRLFPLVALEWP